MFTIWYGSVDFDGGGSFADNTTTAVVQPDPINTPEPSSLLIFGAALMILFIIKCFKAQ